MIAEWVVNSGVIDGWQEGKPPS